MDNEREARAEREVERTAFIQALRDCANFYKQRPGIQAPAYVELNVFLNTKEEIAAHARLAAWEKVYKDSFFLLRRRFGDRFCLEMNIQRDEVCRKVVTGTRVVPATEERTVEIVEWVCDEPVLAGGE